MDRYLGPAVVYNHNRQFKKKHKHMGIELQKLADRDAKFIPLPHNA